MHDHAFCAAVTPGVGAWHQPRCHIVEGLLRRLSEVRWHQGERWGVRERERDRKMNNYREGDRESESEREGGVTYSLLI